MELLMEKKATTMNLQIDQFRPLVLNVGLAVHCADWNWKNVNSPFCRLYYVTEGCARVCLSDKVYTLTPGHMYFIPPFVSHNYECDCRFVHYYLHLYEEFHLDNDLLNSWVFPVEIEAGDFELSLFRRLCEMNPALCLKKSDPATYDNNPTLIQTLLKNKQWSFCDKLESRGIVLQLLSRFIRRSNYNSVSMKDSRVAKVMLYIRQHVHEPIGLDELAERACLSKDHLIRLFKKETGTTPFQYVIQKKIEEAQILLVTENIPVKEIAYRLSFDDYSYFNRLFKKMTGFTPLSYRAMY